MIQSRIKELRYVPSHELEKNPRNWRKHPKIQQDALTAMLAEVGYAGALIARELADGSLQLIDGHLRASLDGNQIVPVLVTDLNEVEADQLIATLDPIAAMAESDDKVLQELLDDLKHSGIDELVVETIAGTYGIRGEMSTDEIEKEWEESGGIETDNAGVENWCAKIVMYFQEPEYVTDFENRLGIEPGTIEKRQKHNAWLYWPTLDPKKTKDFEWAPGEQED